MYKVSETPVYVINLPKRQDRAKEMKETLRGIDFSFFDGCDREDFPVPELSIKKMQKNPHGIYCCALSHIMLIKQAVAEKQKYIMILEDDVFLCDDFLDRLEIIQKELPTFDMCYIGGHFESIKTDIMSVFGEIKKGKLYKAVHIAGTYGYIINCQSEATKFLLRNWTYDWGIDEFYSTHIQPRFNCYAFLPFLIGHKDGFSDVTGWKVAYNCNTYFQKGKL